MTLVATELEEIAASATHPFDLAASYGGETWDLTGATVTILFRSPAGVQTEKTATILDAAAGLARYLTGTTDLVCEARRRERWTFCWRVRQSPIDERTLPVPFLLVSSP